MIECKIKPEYHIFTNIAVNNQRSLSFKEKENNIYKKSNTLNLNSIDI
jgi:hypothetical protein